MTNFVSKYSLYARLMPGILTFLPVFILYCFFVAKFKHLNPANFFGNFHPYFGYIALLPLVFLFSLVCREIGRLIEYWMFKKQDGFPTTYLMLFSNSYFPDEIKNQFRSLVKERFGLEMPTKESEENDRKDAVQKLNLASRFLAIFCQSSEDVQNRNLEYGFYRNLLGGTLIATFFCLIGIAWGTRMNELGVNQWMIFLAVVYILSGLAIRVLIIRRVAEDYAIKALLYFVSSNK